MPRYLVTLQYFGKNYCGSQKQKDRPTIQNEFEQALSTLIKQKISTIFSGRTDAKVSAYGQTLHFDLDNQIKCEKYTLALNAILPPDIAVREIREVDSKFHAQMSAKYRHYQYRVRTKKERSPFDLNSYHLKRDLNVENLNLALNCIVGEHDFSAFKSQSDNPAKICEIYKAQAKREGEYIIIDIVGNRFLYNMVRTIVGTLLMLEKNNIDPLTMADILKSKDRKNSGPTISPIGLTLIEVGYEKYINTERQINENL